MIRPWRSCGLRVCVDLAGDRQREQRVATERNVDSSYERAGDLNRQLLAHDALDRAQLERPDDQRDEPLRAEAERKLSPQRPAALRTPRQQNGDPLLAYAAQRERQHTRRGAVQPLLIVKRDDDRSVRGHRVKEAKDGSAERLRIGWHLPAVPAEQRHRNRPPLGIRQARDDILAHTTKQITETDERRRAIRLARRSREHLVAARSR